MSSKQVTIQARLTFSLVKGRPVDAETLLDAFAGTVGQQNGARRPLNVTMGYEEDLTTPDIVYECYLVEEVG